MLSRSVTATPRSPALRALPRATLNPTSTPSRLHSPSALTSKNLSNPASTAFNRQPLCIAGASRFRSRDIPAQRAFSTTVTMVRTTGHNGVKGNPRITIRDGNIAGLVVLTWTWIPEANAWLTTGPYRERCIRRDRGTRTRAVVGHSTHQCRRCLLTSIGERKLRGRIPYVSESWGSSSDLGLEGQIYPAPRADVNQTGRWRTSRSTSLKTACLRQSSELLVSSKGLQQRSI